MARVFIAALIRTRLNSIMKKSSPKVAIVDYALGNLYSIKNACDYVGLESTITSAKNEILGADIVILPGMGAFGDAMDTLTKLDLVYVLQDFAACGKPLIGICLGIQLLFSKSYEFGEHKGLGLIEGIVVPLGNNNELNKKIKIPQVGWNQLHMARSWENSLLEEVSDLEYMYFVHSFIPQPKDKSIILSTTIYGEAEFCSSIKYNNITACIFHPERSGLAGIKMYRKLATQV